MLRLLALITLTLTACARPEATPTPAPSAPTPQARAALAQAPAVGEKLQLSDAEWKQKLSPEQYRVLREQGTERAFSGAYWKEKGEGVYACAACGAPLYSSADKFASGTGWPSYTRAIESGRVIERSDHSFGATRTEILCARCGGHLGHVFDDGPAPTGQRHCVNSASLSFESAEH